MFLEEISGSRSHFYRKDYKGKKNEEHSYKIGTWNVRTLNRGSKLKMKKYCLESRSRGISYMKYVNGRRTGLVTFCVETAFYNGLLKERYKGG